MAPVEEQGSKKELIANYVNEMTATGTWFSCKVMGALVPHKVKIHISMRVWFRNTSEAVVNMSVIKPDFIIAAIYLCGKNEAHLGSTGSNVRRGTHLEQLATVCYA